MALPRLMLVGGLRDSPGLFRIVREAYAGGLRLFQLREKTGHRDQPQTRDALLRLRRDCPGLHLLVNSQADLARDLDAGLHLPETVPFPANWAPNALWGRSVHGLDAAFRAADEGAHYLVLGTIFPTRSKPGHPGAGLELVSQVSGAVDIPVFAIGGLDARTATGARSAGAHGIAIQRAILAADCPRRAVAELLETAS